jgi:DNA mismatch repair protein MSH5
MLNHNQIGCAGAVLSEIQRRKAAEYHPNDPDAFSSFRIKSLTMLTLSNSMFVNADALASLQILGSEAHPNTMMQGPDKANSGAKESLSVYGLLHFLASTPQGKAKLRQHFLRPRVDLGIIRERQHTISVLLRPENGTTIENLTKTLKKIRNIRTTMTALHKGVSRPPGQASVERGTWAALQCFAAHVVDLRGSIRSIQGGDTLEISAKVRLFT